MTALAGSGNGGNGVYAYGGGTFPTGTYSYYVIKQLLSRWA